MKQYNSILIIKMSSLGDILHALPTLYALRKNQPNAYIVWAIHEQFAPILPGKPYIDEVILIDKRKLINFSYLRHLQKKLHAYHFSMALDLQGLAKSAVVAFLSGAPERYGYWEMREGSQFINKGLVGPNRYGHAIERYLDTVRVLGGQVDSIRFPLPAFTEAKRSVSAKLAKDGLVGDYVVIVPGARWNVKEWPLDYWSELINHIAATGMNVVLLGGNDDIGKGEYLIKQANFASGCIYNLVGRTNLTELVAAIAASVCYISADTGPLHIANALQKKLIALFGTTSAARTGPYGGEHVHLLISPTSRATAKVPLVHDPQCMRQITVAAVWNIYQKIIKKDS